MAIDNKMATTRIKTAMRILEFGMLALGVLIISPAVHAADTGRGFGYNWESDWNPGLVSIHLLAGQNIWGNTIVVRRTDVGDGHGITLEIHPDGTYDDLWNPGNYSIELPEGWNRAPEFQNLTVTGGFRSYAIFRGQGSSGRCHGGSEKDVPL